MSSAPARTAGCCATMPTLRPSSRANPTMMFCAQPGWISRNSPSSTIAPMTSCMSYGFDGVVGDDRVERGVAPVRADRSSRRRGGSARLFCGRNARMRARRRQRRRLVRRREVGDAAARRVGRRAAEPLRVDVLVGHGLHDVRPGDEHVARALDHDGEVRDRRRVHRSPGARAQDDRELRHDAGRQGVAQEDVGVAAERHDAFLDPRAAGIVQADDRRADLHREVHDLADLLGVRLRQRSTEHREVLAEDEDEPAVDRAVAGDDAVAEDARRQPERPSPRCVTNASSSTNESGVEQQLEPLARRQLAARVLLLDARLRRRRAATRCAHRLEPRESAPRSSARRLLRSRLSLRKDSRCGAHDTSVHGCVDDAAAIRGRP